MSLNIQNKNYYNTEQPSRFSSKKEEKTYPQSASPENDFQKPLPPRSTLGSNNHKSSNINSLLNSNIVLNRSDSASALFRKHRTRVDAIIGLLTSYKMHEMRMLEKSLEGGDSEKLRQLRSELAQEIYQLFQSHLTGMKKFPPFSQVQAQIISLITRYTQEIRGLEDLLTKKHWELIEKYRASSSPRNGNEEWNCENPENKAILDRVHQDSRTESEQVENTRRKFAREIYLQLLNASVKPQSGKQKEEKGEILLPPAPSSTTVTQKEREEEESDAEEELPPVVIQMVVDEEQSAAVEEPPVVVGMVIENGPKTEVEDKDAPQSSSQVIQTHQSSPPPPYEELEKKLQKRLHDHYKEINSRPITHLEMKELKRKLKQDFYKDMALPSSMQTQLNFVCVNSKGTGPLMFDYFDPNIAEAIKALLSEAAKLPVKSEKIETALGELKSYEDNIRSRSFKLTESLEKSQALLKIIESLKEELKGNNEIAACLKNIKLTLDIIIKWFTGSEATRAEMLKVPPKLHGVIQFLQTVICRDVLPPGEKIYLRIEPILGSRLGYAYPRKGDSMVVIHSELLTPQENETPEEAEKREELAWAVFAHEIGHTLDAYNPEFLDIGIRALDKFASPGFSTKDGGLVVGNFPDPYFGQFSRSSGGIYSIEFIAHCLFYYTDPVYFFEKYPDLFKFTYCLHAGIPPLPASVRP